MVYSNASNNIESRLFDDAIAIWCLSHELETDFPYTKCNKEKLQSTNTGHEKTIDIMRMHACKDL